MLVRMLGHLTKKAQPEVLRQHSAFCEVLWESQEFWHNPECGRCSVERPAIIDLVVFTSGSVYAFAW
ncbi:unnamed protein product, partial [marine sediment metagenome]